jgi:exopolyphosphatase/guanosine-5'-triphosphate,3'-diphosphate pyrophosphatase
MREAYNGKEVVELIKEKADINIEIIDGKRGGDYCFNRFASFVKTDETYLFVDVGGGSRFTLSQIAK